MKNQHRIQFWGLIVIATCGIDPLIRVIAFVLAAITLGIAAFDERA